MLVDSHCHLLFYSRDEIDGILQECSNAGVIYLQNISTELEKLDELASFSYNYPNISCSIGVHPCSVEDNIPSVEMLDIMYNKHKSVINAVGETGLDYFHDRSKLFAKQQQEALVNHAKLAIKYNIPLVIHLRGEGVEEDFLEIMMSFDKNNRPSGVLHCFGGSLDFMKKMIEFGFFVSFSGNITFKSATNIRELSRNVPKDRLLIETDSPFLSPHPFRGQRNNPSRVGLVLDCITKEIGISREEGELLVCKNYSSLFNVDLSKQMS